MLQTRVLNHKKDKGGFTHLTLAPPPSYRYSPGQYVSVSYKESEKAKFLAIASHAGEDTLLFVSKNDDPPPQTVFISEALGDGFTCDFGDKKPFLFLTHGTGISAIRPAMLERKFRNMGNDTLLYGIRSAVAEPELDCLTENFGVKQLRALSQAEYKAYVQDLIHTLELEQFGTILLVGGSEMMVTVREILAAKNFPKEKIFSNY